VCVCVCTYETKANVRCAPEALPRCKADREKTNAFVSCVAQKVICLHCAEEIAEAVHANEAISEWTYYAPEHVIVCEKISAKWRKRK
jgi:hypothetical protein